MTGGRTDPSAVVGAGPVGRAGGCCCGASWTETVTDAEVVDVFERVRDIPFSFAPHTDAMTLLRHGSGTCAPKHALLAQEYERLGVPTRFVYVTYRLDDMPGEFPPELQPLVHDGIVRGHAALQIYRSGGWLDVDATFDRPLKAHGFVVTEGWDGRSSMPLVVVPLSRVETAEPPARVEAVLGIQHRTTLPRDLLARVNAWLDGVRPLKEVQHG
jgi:transglutaminase-like putative cysteine protease